MDAMNEKPFSRRDFLWSSLLASAAVSPLAIVNGPWTLTTVMPAMTAISIMTTSNSTSEKPSSCPQRLRAKADARELS